MPRHPVSTCVHFDSVTTFVLVNDHHVNITSRLHVGLKVSCYIFSVSHVVELLKEFCTCKRILIVINVNIRSTCTIIQDARLILYKPRALSITGGVLLFKCNIFTCIHLFCYFSWNYC